MVTRDMTDGQKIEEARRAVLAVVRAMVHDPDAVSVLVAGGSDKILFEIHVAPRDIGKVAGTEGAHRRLIEALLKPISGNHGIGYALDSIG